MDRDQREHHQDVGSTWLVSRAVILPHQREMSAVWFAFLGVTPRSSFVGRERRPACGGGSSPLLELVDMSIFLQSYELCVVALLKRVALHSNYVARNFLPRMLAAPLWLGAFRGLDCRVSHVSL